MNIVSNNDALVLVQDVNKIYGNEVKHHVLIDINLTIPKGSFTGIIGPSGSGKSTLLNLIGTLDRPTSGHIIIDNERVDEWDSKRQAEFRNRDLGFIFQHHHLLPEFSVMENIMMPAMIAGKHKSQKVQSYAHKIISLIGLSDHINKQPSEISGGQQQRVAIARALINKPKLILADEPGASLDTKLTSEVYELLAELNQKLNTTILLITHENTVREFVDNIIELQDGLVI